MSDRKRISEQHMAAWQILSSRWEHALSISDIDSARDLDWSGKVAQLLFDSGSTYPYILITQILGKATSGNLNALCLQDSSALDNAWDARTLASKVVVQWNKAIGRPLPGSNDDPFVNNPARYKNFGEEMESKAKNKELYQKLFEIVSLVESKGQEAALHFLDIALIEIRFHLESTNREYLGPSRVSIEDVMKILREFLKERSNGVRLQIVTYAIFKTLSHTFASYGQIRSYPTNSSDKAGGRAGDIEKILLDKVDTAIEVKDRTINFNDVETSILKCRPANVNNLLFVIQADPLMKEEEKILERVRHEFTRGIDVNFCSAENLFNTALMILSAEQRPRLLNEIHQALEQLGAHLKHRNHWRDLVKSI